ncbi:response regulator [Halodesulfovibrio marinisediminis]|uniref:Two component transcriptional regulator, LuxR family n=1 Tax=Halodesulfovibrio marinisediminis DSM 17456 TaxID=1121457 RepID=A0A1N6GQX4_9BACT|nr:response regulator transcription factor [Halodesulfovibrio marinisediminis]SIO09887.1 two component transcriptional regulator, LuxR family [Halodesulfovibrio marinisediminis DSM 17456]
MKNSPNKPIRILLVDNHEIYRIGLREGLSSNSDMTIVGEASSGEEALSQAVHLTPDVILMNIGMPVMDGVQASLEMKKRNLSSKIVILTHNTSGDTVFSAIKSGAMGYLLKNISIADLSQSIRKVCSGEPAFTPSIALEALSIIASPGEHKHAEPHPLTPREVEILQLVAEGKGNKTIADELTVSEATVSTHMNNILTKLHLSNRVQATLYALRKGLSSLN